MAVPACSFRTASSDAARSKLPFLTLKKIGPHLELIVTHIISVSMCKRTDDQGGFARATEAELGSITSLRVPALDVPAVESGLSA
jgi:hypothetical protein